MTLRKHSKNDLQYKVGIMGCPSRPDVTWSRENLSHLQDLGFNTMQVNIAWGSRPGDEPLNLEDVVELPGDKEKSLGQPIALKSDPSPEARQNRCANLRHRLDLCRQMRIGAIFHFGAPYNGSSGYDDTLLVNCLLDGKTQDRYVCLLRALAEQYQGVDDVLIYTYDQDAWLCNEFGPCPRCRAVPLHERVVPFINQLGRTWRSMNPKGRLWWEPWELSAGQVLKCIEQLDPETVGLALHSNIAEVMATHAVDRWLKNAAALAANRGIPVIVEAYLSGASEELEPFAHLQHPLVTLRALRAINETPGVIGIKEYYGLLGDREDPNLRMTGLFFADPHISEEEALMQLAAPYGRAAETIIAFWRLCSEAMELFPWETSWYIREIGKCNVRHSMTAAFIRGQQCHTPSWDSTRRAIFMKCDDEQPHPWMLEDVQLRCELAAQRMAEALAVGQAVGSSISRDLGRSLEKCLVELDGFRRRALSYAYHLRETNLATVMRACRQKQTPIPAAIIAEMIALLKKDQINQHADEPIGAALQLLQTDVGAFLDRYFQVVADGGAQGGVKLTEADFSVTSRRPN